MVRLRPLSVADEDDALLLLCNDADLLFFLLSVEDPGLVVRVVLSFFFFFWLASLFDFWSSPAEADAVGRGGRLMVTTRALPLPVPPDRRDDDVPDTALVTSEGAPCLEERQTSASPPPLAEAAAEADADADRPPPQTAERARKGGIALAQNG